VFTVRDCKSVNNTVILFCICHFAWAFVAVAPASYICDLSAPPRAQASIVEIYNEAIFDLLSDSPRETASKLEIKESGCAHVHGPSPAAGHACACTVYKPRGASVPCCPWHVPRSQGARCPSAQAATSSLAARADPPVPRAMAPLTTRMLWLQGPHLDPGSLDVGRHLRR
jgi:hypothetical protein